MSFVGGRILGGQQWRAEADTFVLDGASLLVERAEPGSQRQLQLMLPGGGTIAMTLGPMERQQVSVGAFSVEVRGEDLYINGRKVDLSKPGTSLPPAPANPALLTLQSRFPGAKLSGDPSGVEIGPHVVIEPGARVDLRPGLAILGSTTIKSGAVVSGGTIRDSTIAGEVSGGTIEQGSDVRRGATVTGGRVVGSTLDSGAMVTGGVSEASTLRSGSMITGGRARRMVLEAGSMVTGGHCEGYTLSPGSIVSGGSNIGGSRDIDTGGVTFIGGTVTAGGRSHGSDQVSVGRGAIHIAGANTGAINTGSIVSGAAVSVEDQQTLEQIAALLARLAR
ncbi:MAG: hypothetical protein IT384_18465 [Deltaproteobacteria bacterium]|nr:hypothetical protein [Deltaproteobacteria bacterium]